MLKSSLLFFAAAVLVVLCLPIGGRNPQAASSSPAQAAAPAGKNPVRPTAESQAKAKMLFTRDCALCHGDTGNGKNTLDIVIEDWTVPATLAGKSDSELFTAIRSGKGDKMPPEDVGRANDTEVWNLIIYIRGLSKNQPAAAPAESPAPPPPPPTK